MHSHLALMDEYDNVKRIEMREKGLVCVSGYEPGRSYSCDCTLFVHWYRYRAVNKDETAGHRLPQLPF